MADGNSSSSATGVVAIVAIMLMLLIAGFLAFRAGIFGGGGNKKSLDVNVNVPGQSGN